MKIESGLAFQIKVSMIDLIGRSIAISKVLGFTLKYYVDPGEVFTASKSGSTLVNCIIEKDQVIVTINYAFTNKGVLKSRMEIIVNDLILPEEPFTFNCPEQKTEVEII